jgi:hypothetical protein
MGDVVWLHERRLNDRRNQAQARNGLEPQARRNGEADGADAGGAGGEAAPARVFDMQRYVRRRVQRAPDEHLLHGLPRTHPAHLGMQSPSARVLPFVRPSNRTRSDDVPPRR